MDREEKVLQEYILYVQHKENFVNRTFQTNRFYLITSLVVLTISSILSVIQVAPIMMFTVLFAMIGIVLCVLWIMNNNSYKRLLKIKFQNVIERLEDELPVKPYQMESTVLREENKKKKIFFADMQKVLSVMIFVTYMVIIVNEVIMAINLFD